ncbi:MAG: NADH:flavin oxidoreductase [Nitrospirae bacterium]|nr:NADH:flavin oxidoreductase [Nitrospirota bacterium]MCL5422734.1 NADH:flavin oxidoreductase [Nitrospirota bacterium]
MLFEPFSFSGLNLKNRLVRSATYEKRADEDGFVTESLIELYEDLTRGGIGLMITGNALVHPSGRTIPQMTCIHSDIYIQGLRKLTSAVHELDGVIAIQLTHGGRQSFPILLGGNDPLAPSAVYDSSTKIMPRAMTDTEIWEIIDAFADAARRARIAGFDAVQIHSAHGYLVSEFLSPYTNRRDDYWGGDEERRFHFPEEVYKAMRKEVGEDYPIMIKMNADDLIEGGLRGDEAVKIAVRLEELGLDAVEVSGGMYESNRKTAQPDILSPDEEAYFRNHGRAFKSKLHIPVMLVGGMRSRTVMEDVLQKGEADLISLARPLIREPDLPNKFREGKEGADCISCNGCMDFGKLDVVECIQLR